MTLTPKSAAYAEYEAHKTALLERFREMDQAGEPFRLKKSTSNLFRSRSAAGRRYLDLRSFNHVLSIEPAEGWADVEGMATYETVVAALLPCGFMPAVVPELKSITVGGAISGGGIESSSFRCGFVHETVSELDLLTGTGECVTCRPDNENRELFFSFPCSYGALGYCLRARIRIVPTHPYVKLRHRRFKEMTPFFEEMERLCRSHRAEGSALSFIDGSVFAEGEYILTTGEWAETAPWVSDYTGKRIYYRSLREEDEDWLTTAGYLWRWDTDWFWCSRAFGAENPILRSLYRRFGLLRSTTYWKIKTLLQRVGLLAILGRGKEYVIQDVEIPITHAPEFLNFMLREVRLLPIWICPAAAPDSDRRFPLYPTDPAILYVNFGFWGGVPSNRAPGHFDRMVEEKTTELGGRKSLYSTSWFKPEVFDLLYNEPHCRELKKRWDPKNRFPQRFDKCVRKH
jgi:FAD/FMN-containing dehydrogenase